MTEPLSIYQREVWTTFDHHLRWSVFCRILHAIIILKMFPYGWREVKSGEELRELFTPPNALFIGVCEGWVKSEEYLAKFSAATYCCNILPLHPYRCTLLGLEKVSFRVLESNFSIVATRLGSSAEPSQQVCRLQSAPLSSLVGIPCCRTTITPLVVRLYTL